MDLFYRPTWAEVALDAIRHNVEAFRSALPRHVSLIAVVKADAYGHGAVPVAKEALASGADSLAVACFDEALELRRAGIGVPILVMGYTGEEAFDLAAKLRITLTIFTEQTLDLLARRDSRSKRIAVQIKIDSGMGRIGLADEQAAIRFVERAVSLPGIRVDGLFTHYACADESDKTFTIRQHHSFFRLVDRLKEKGMTFPYVHAGNSATGIDVPELAGSAVRLGISMYGLYPSAQVNRTRIALRPAMSLRTKIVMWKQVEEGTGISYGQRYRASGPEQIATLPIGYADGFTRMRFGKAEAIVRGMRVPVVGTICMDQCMINVTGVEAEIGDVVTLLGKEGQQVIHADDWADHLGTINYEVTCMISRRVPRVYTRNGAVVDTVNLLNRT